MFNNYHTDIEVADAIDQNEISLKSLLEINPEIHFDHDKDCVIINYKLKQKLKQETNMSCKSYGDNCENDECPKHRDGKCRKNEEYYDQTIPKDERLNMLIEQLSSMIFFHEQLGNEIKQLLTIGALLATDETEDILKDIEGQFNEA